MLFGPQHLPTEILESILYYLSQSSLYQCLYVCKAWSLSAHVLFYKKLTIDNGIHGIEFPSHPIYRYKDTIEKLVIKEVETNHSQEQHFVQSVLKRLSNLKVLDFSDSPVLFSKVRTLLDLRHVQINLPRIQEIIICKYPSVPKENANVSKKVIKGHFFLCKRVCQTITRLTFSDTILRDWMKCIHIYVKLTHLTIHNNYAFRLPNIRDASLMAFFLCQCPNLIEFTLLNSFYLPDDYDEFPEETEELCMDISDHEEAHAISSERIPVYLPSTAHFNLTILSLALPTIDTSQMKYIISYIPSLKSFNLRLTRINVHTWLDQNCQTTILQFASHLSLIKDLVFTMSTLPSFLVRVESISPTIYRQTDFLCSFLNNLKGSARKIQSSYTRLHLFFKPRRPVNTSTNFSFQIKNDHHLCFEYAIMYTDLIFREQANLSSPFLVAISPIVMMGQKKELDIIITQNVLNGVVQYALANFNHIDILRIYTHELSMPESEFDREYVIKYVRKYGITSAHVRDLSCFSNDRFPDIRILAIESDRFMEYPMKPKLRHVLSRLSSNPSEQVVAQGTFILDLSDYKHLQQLHLSVPSISDQDSFILVKMKSKTGAKEDRTSFRTYQSMWGNYMLVENDSRLKRGSAIPLKYTIIFHIKTILNITFSIS